MDSSRLANLGTDACKGRELSAFTGMGKNWRISEPKEFRKLQFLELSTDLERCHELSKAVQQAGGRPRPLWREIRKGLL